MKSFTVINPLENEVEKLGPVDVYIERPRWKVTPIGVKMRNKQSTVGRLRVKLWLQRVEVDDEAPSTPVKTPSTATDAVSIVSESSDDDEAEETRAQVAEPAFEPVNPASIPPPYDVRI